MTSTTLMFIKFSFKIIWCLKIILVVLILIISKYFTLLLPFFVGATKIQVLVSLMKHFISTNFQDVSSNKTCILIYIFVFWDVVWHDM